MFKIFRGKKHILLPKCIFFQISIEVNQENRVHTLLAFSLLSSFLCHSQFHTVPFPLTLFLFILKSSFFTFSSFSSFSSFLISMISRIVYDQDYRTNDLLVIFYERTIYDSDSRFYSFFFSLRNKMFQDQSPPG